MILIFSLNGQFNLACSSSETLKLYRISYEALKPNIRGLRNVI